MQQLNDSVSVRAATMDDVATIVRYNRLLALESENRQLDADVLTRGAAKSTVKREMLRSLGRISEAIDAVMVAEGIETPDDLVVLKDLGVKYGQGYFLARPGAPFPRLRASIKRAVRALASGSLEPIPAPPAEEYDEEGEPSEERRAVPIVLPAAQAMLSEAFDEDQTSAAVVEDPTGEVEPVN